MDRRIELDDLLKEIANAYGAHVYYQPPSSVKMQYPAIRYERSRTDTDHADNLPYRIQIGYQITVIDRNPDSEITKAILKLPLCSYNRHYYADNLNHDVFIIYY